MRHSTLLDQVILQFDASIRSILPPEKRLSQRPSPADGMAEIHLTQSEQKHISGLVRVNHSGEVCAQALYQGQGLVAKEARVREKMKAASNEENDHLAWCEQRLGDLDASPSLFNAFWYVHSFLIGLMAGILGDKYSLGFVAETERQVEQHLDRHLQQLPSKDKKTWAILKQMQEDEAHHAEMAIASGGITLPTPIQQLMGMMSKVMTHTSYYV